MNLSAKFVDVILKNPHRFTQVSINLPKQCVNIETINKLCNKRLCKNLNWSALTKSSYITLNDILSNPHLPWKWEDISKNENIEIKDIFANKDKLAIHINEIISGVDCKDITFKDILSNLELNWNWCRISRNFESLNITRDDLLFNPRLPWDWNYIHIHEIYKIGITFQDMLNHREIIWYWDNISANGYKLCITFQDMLNHPEIPWNWRIISFYTKEYGITFTDVKNNMNLPWNWESLEDAYEISVEFMLQYRDKMWDFNNITEIDIEIPLNNQDIKWDWNQIIRYNKDKITIDMIIENPGKQWEIVFNCPHIFTNISINDILNNHNLGKWDWHRVATHSTYGITVDIMVNHPEIKWPYFNLLSHTRYYYDRFSTSFKDVVSHPELDWDWSAVTWMGDVSIEYILDNPDKDWNWDKVQDLIFDN